MGLSENIETNEIPIVQEPQCIVVSQECADFSSSDSQQSGVSSG